jgi:predicted nucleic acid-binding protein
MSAKYFLDTNIVVYAFDKSAPKKQAQARELLDIDKDWVISWQVIQEFSSVALHRFTTPVSPSFLKDFIAMVLWPKCQILPTCMLYEKATEIHQQAQYRYDDALIVASAIESGAPVLYTEDLQHGRTLDSMKIENPFC